MASQPRLYVKGRVLGYRRSHNVQHPSTTLIKIEGLEDRNDVGFYLGNRVAYIYRGHVAKKGIKGETSKTRVMWGRITRSHGNRGVVRAHFRNNLPPKAFGRNVRVMLYPSKI